MKKYKEILLKAITQTKYYNNEDLRVNKKHNILLSGQELKEYLTYKEDFEHELKVELPLKSFNSKKIYFYKSNELQNLTNDYNEFIVDDLFEKESGIASSDYQNLVLYQIASEIEGTSKIEGVNTSRKRILEIINKDNLKNKEDIYIKNMKEAHDYIFSLPQFNEDNLFKLYEILTHNLLEEHQKIDGQHYRKGMVYISNHQGCSPEIIKECMDSLFNYVKDEANNPYLPFIVHYYILYIHPYYDFNGRMARLVSIWISLLSKNKHPKYISEAINEDKNNYYKAIDNTRNSKNDLTYFITYLLRLSNKYYLVYKNLNQIKEDLALFGVSITSTESYYLKRIIINSKKGWFNYKGFINFSNINITKQGALKILNNFLGLNILKARINNRNEKIFILNEEIIKFKLNDD